VDPADLAALQAELNDPALNIEVNYLLSAIFQGNKDKAIPIGRKTQSDIKQGAAEILAGAASIIGVDGKSWTEDTDVSIETGLLNFVDRKSEETSAELVLGESFINSQRKAAQYVIATATWLEQVPENAMNELYKAVSGTHRLAIEGFLQNSTLYINAARLGVASGIASGTKYLGLDTKIAQAVGLNGLPLEEGIAGGVGIAGAGAAELLLRQYGAPAVGTLMTNLLGNGAKAGVTAVFDNSVNRFRNQATGRFVKGAGSKLGAIGPVGLLVTQAYHTYETTRYLTSTLGTTGIGVGGAVGLYFGGAKGAAVGAAVGASVGIGAGIAAGIYLAAQGTAAIVTVAGAGTAAAAAAPFVLGAAAAVGAVAGVVGVARSLVQYYDTVLSVAEKELLAKAGVGKGETEDQTRQRLLELANRGTNILNKFVAQPIKSMELEKSQKDTFDAINSDLLAPAVTEVLKDLPVELQKKIEKNGRNWNTGLSQEELSTVITQVLTRKSAQKGGGDNSPIDMFLERVVVLIYLSKLHLLGYGVKMEMIIKLTLREYAKFLLPLLNNKLSSETICIEAIIPFPALKINEETKTSIVESTLALENYKTGDELNLFKLSVPSSGAARIEEPVEAEPVEAEPVEAEPVEAEPVKEVARAQSGVADIKQKISVAYSEELALLKQLEYATYKRVTAELIRDICLEKQYTDCVPKQEDFETMEEAEKEIQTKYDDKVVELQQLGSKSKVKDENKDARPYIMSRIKKLKDVNELRMNSKGNPMRNKNTSKLLETFQTKFKKQVSKLYTQIETKGFFGTTKSWADPEPGLAELLKTAYESTMAPEEKAYLTRKNTKGGYRRTYKQKRI
jgi:hypothetical protein